MANERKCIICGKSYKFCNHCPGGSTTESWKNLYDSEECRTIFNVASRFSSGSLTAEKAMEELEGITIPDTLSGGVKKSIDGILSVKKAKALPAVVEEEAVIEDKAEEEPVPEVKEEAPKTRRKQNKIVK